MRPIEHDARLGALAAIDAAPAREALASALGGPGAALAFPRIVEGSLVEHDHGRRAYWVTETEWSRAPRILWSEEHARGLGIDPRSGVTVWPLPEPLGIDRPTRDKSRRG